MIGIKVHSTANTFTSPTLGAYGMMKDMVNSYLMADGSRFTDRANYKTFSFYDEMQQRDLV